MNWIIRDFVPEDKNFIVSSWFQSHRSQAKLDYDVYNKYQHSLIHLILSRAKVVIAEFDGVILGYIVFEESQTPIVHYAYTKANYLKMGIATSLLRRVSTSRFFYTHQTKRKIEGGQFNPYLAYNDFNQGK